MHPKIIAERVPEKRMRPDGFLAERANYITAQRGWWQA